MAYEYDNQNIFAKILRGEIPNDTVLETDHTLAFNDIAPQAPVHVLVIPRGPYVTWDHFAAKASDAEIIDYARAIRKVIDKFDLSPGEHGQGYRLLVNGGEAGIQEVPHLHTHVLSGRILGRMLPG
ncbi:HIT domain-containing protein [Maritimibacter sp. UBA3975]|uniref:HIT domain-containing protein n=1 Tax=Maritimibacter sp. UBA3975 TaxID=1946833 RepID=UPI000C09386D|nr:HIT domain-containing protein [Maritimibacter sp. UBA3975]MAM63930.1 histidine triad nucleotide-binding protein [Maritimibacter sp.]|tara:strand:- start:11213 stop:11590 length:378 start_codon:yes stop_codon:yes gene_type:complete